jgi:hypothetical protein
MLGHVRRRPLVIVISPPFHPPPVIIFWDGKGRRCPMPGVPSTLMGVQVIQDLSMAVSLIFA